MTTSPCFSLLVRTSTLPAVTRLRTSQIVNVCPVPPQFYLCFTCLHRLFSGPNGLAFSVSFCITPRSLFTLRSPCLGPFCGRVAFPLPHSPPFSRYIFASVVVPTPSPFARFLSINNFWVASAFAFVFILPFVCSHYLLSVPNRFFVFLSIPSSHFCLPAGHPKHWQVLSDSFPNFPPPPKKKMTYRHCFRRTLLVSVPTAIIGVFALFVFSFCS